MYYIKNIFIQNFRGISYEKIVLWSNKTVFVWKNWSWKTTCLKAIEKLLNSKKIKEKDFKDKTNKLILEARIGFNDEDIHLKIEATYKDGKVEVISNLEEKKQKYILKKINLIYIPADRKINQENKEDWYLKLIDLILKTKEEKLDKIVKTAYKKLGTFNDETGRKKTTLLLSLLRLYMYSIANTKNDYFNIFIIDQPENFLHPHATRMMDEILQKIWEFENTKVFYSTNSSDLVSNFKKWKYEISDIIFVTNINNNIKTKIILNEEGKYDRIMISLIFKNAYMFFSDAIILVEWETEKISIPNIFENTNLLKYCGDTCKNLTPEKRENYFNLNYKNISVVDVGWKWSLYDWYLFASELFWKENVVALIDRDENFRVDREMIIKSIRTVYKVNKIYENDFKKYRWIVLDGEFEDYYDINVIKWFIQDTIKKRAKRFWHKFDKNKYYMSLKKLDKKLERIKSAKKTSVVYESIFNSYFRKYSKPTIAFNLSIWLCENNGYDEQLLKMLSTMIQSLDNKKNQ